MISIESIANGLGMTTQDVVAEANKRNCVLIYDNIQLENPSIMDNKAVELIAELYKSPNTEVKYEEEYETIDSPHSPNFNINHGDDFCWVCGKDIKSRRNVSFVAVCSGGDRLVRWDQQGIAEEKDDGWMGVFPVGSECSKQIPSEYKG